MNTERKKKLMESIAASIDDIAGSSPNAASSGAARDLAEAAERFANALKAVSGVPSID